MPDPELLALLRCPRTLRPLRRSSPEEQTRLAARGVNEALVTADGAIAYRIHDGIPVLLADEAIPLDDSS